MLLIAILAFVAILQVYLYWFQSQKQPETPDIPNCLLLKEDDTWSDTIVNGEGRLISIRLIESYDTTKRYISSCTNKDHLGCANALLELFKVNYGPGPMYEDLRAEMIAAEVNVVEKQAS